MKRLICVIIAGLIMSIASHSLASSEISTIRIKSGIECWSSIYTSGNCAVFQTKTILEVWNFVENKKIADLTFEDFSSKIPEIDIENSLPEGINLAWRDKREIKKRMDMNKKFLIDHISLSADGGKIALTQTDGSVILWNTLSNKIIPLIPEGVRGTKFSPSGRFIGILNTRGKGKSFSIIDTQENKELISLPSNAGMTGIIEFSQNEHNVYIGISDFIVGYELKTANNIVKNKIPIKFHDDKIEKSTISADGKLLACSTYPFGALVELTNEGKAKKIHSRENFFVKDSLIVKSRHDFKKIDFNKIDKFMETPNQSLKDDALFTTVNIPVKMDVETIADSSYYSFNMEEELGETVVKITKILF